MTHQSAQDFGARHIVEGSGGRWVVTDLSTGQTVGPLHLQHTDAQAAADRLNQPASARRRPRQRSLFDSQGG